MHLKQKNMLFKWIYKPSGQCPVQADGAFLNHKFYFRARWDEVNIEFYRTEYDGVSFLLKKTVMYEAGWLPHSQCKLLIYKGCIKFAFWLLRKKIKNLFYGKTKN